MGEETQVHLVGSVPLADNEAVFRAVAERVGARARRIPDGETGERTNWIVWQGDVIAGTPGMVAQERKAAYDGVGTFTVAEGTDPASVTFGELGYAAAALDSWAAFERLQADGTIAGDVRFQVSLPTPVAPIVRFVAPEHVAVLEPAYADAMAREVAAIADAIPHDRLAIQWDTAVEFGILEGVMPSSIATTVEDVADRIAALGALVPGDVELGYHLCYGDAGHRHFVEPQDTALLVQVADALFARLERPVAFLHLPVPRDRDDAGYFAPLRELALPAGTELHLGLVHATDGEDGAARRIQAAKEIVPTFGVATECGFGRRDPGTVPALLDLHAAAAQQA